MSYAALMVFVDAAGTPENRVRLAAGLAEKFNSRLIGLSALAIHPPFMIDTVVIEETMNVLAAKGDWFRKIAGGAGKLEWRPVLDYPADALTSEARSADLIIIGQTASADDPYGSLDPGEALLRMGRPVLVVPDGVSLLKAEHVVIGWKDAREARRAIQDALPFLHEAQRATVAEICAPGDERSAQQHVDDVAAYLTRHRIKSEARVIIEGDGPGAAQLVKFAQGEGSDLLVTGAYGHSRMGEWIFGGMTHDLLSTSPLCCLMSH